MRIIYFPRLDLETQQCSDFCCFLPELIIYRFQMSVVVDLFGDRVFPGKIQASIFLLAGPTAGGCFYQISTPSPESTVQLAPLSLGDKRSPFGALF